MYADTYKTCSYTKGYLGYKVMKSNTYFGNTGTTITSLTAGNYLLVVHILVLVVLLVCDNNKCVHN